MVIVLTIVKMILKWHFDDIDGCEDHFFVFLDLNGNDSVMIMMMKMKMETGQKGKWDNQPDNGEK